MCSFPNNEFKQIVYKKNTFAFVMNMHSTALGLFLFAVSECFAIWKWNKLKICMYFVNELHIFQD